MAELENGLDVAEISAGGEEPKSELRWVLDGQIYGKPTMEDLERCIKEYQDGD